MATSKSDQAPLVRISDKFSEAFSRFQDQIRERAYHLSLERKTGEKNSLADWLAAQTELSNPIHLKMTEQKKNFVVEGELKGFSPDEIELEVASNRLQVFGSHIEVEKSKKSEGGGTTSHTVTFFQSLTLPADVEPDKGHAKLFKNGKLKVTLPKKM